MTSRKARALPLRWRLLDAVDRGLSRLWPFGSGAAVGWAFLVPALALVGILVAGFVFVVDDSFRALDLATYRLSEDYSLANYEKFVESASYMRVLGRTLLAAAIVTLITLILSFPYAYILVRSRSALVRKLLLVALLLPFFIGQVVRAYGWLIILGKEGLINQALGGMGLPALDLIYNYPSVIFGLIQYMLPFGVLLIIPAITAISEDIELASEGLGARWPSTFRHIVLPMAKPGLIGAGVVVFTLTLTDFAMPEILGGGTSDFIASSIYDSFFQLSNPGLGAALSVILVMVGSLLVAGVFVLVGTGTLGVRGVRK
ncbi:ABC transporter permease [Roseovarius sp. SYSU LYC5161]|uniref:ABC transporter permease n=1 Tax=Roseovarius halophilus (ex Wu et al. 2025) TaxID=3376060 RepID=UPI00399B3122